MGGGYKCLTVSLKDFGHLKFVEAEATLLQSCKNVIR